MYLFQIRSYFGKKPLIVYIVARSVDKAKEIFKNKYPGQIIEECIVHLKGVVVEEVK